MWIKKSFKIGMQQFEVEAKVFEKPSKYGIDEGRISKLYLRRNHYPFVIKDTIALYDRGWVIEPRDDADKKAYEFAKKLILGKNKKV